MYEIYCKIRDSKGYKDSDVSKGANVTKSTFSDWKNGRSTPKGEKLAKIARFLNVSVDTLMGAENISYDSDTHTWEENEEEYYLDSDAKEMAEFLKSNPEYKVLFDASRKVKKEDIQKALKMLGILGDD